MYGITWEHKNAERVSVDLCSGGQVREDIGTKSRNQGENPTRNPTRFQNGRFRTTPNTRSTNHINDFHGIQQDQDISNKISENPTRKSNKNPDLAPKQSHNILRLQ